MDYTENQQKAVDSLNRTLRHRNYTLRHALEAGNQPAKVSKAMKDRMFLSDSHKTMLINLPKNQLTLSNIKRLFAYTTPKGSFDVREPIINTKAVCTLTPGEFTNKEEVETTAGSILFNKLFVEGKCDHLVENGYVNDVMTKKKIEGLLSLVATGFRNKTVTLEQLALFLKDFEFYGLELVTVFSPSFTKGIITPHPEVIKKRAELLSKLPDPPSLADIVRVEDELTAFARTLAKDDAGMTLYDSGSRGSFDNDYKTISIMGGAVLNPATGKPSVIKNSFLEGVEKEDIPTMGTAMVAASYPKAVGTQVGGYLTKQFYAVYQAMVVDEDGTDCGTKMGIKKVLTNTNYKHYLYQNIQMSDGTTVTLTEETKSQFIGKEVIIRSPMYCTADKFCSVCIGRTPYDYDMKNIGLNAGSISNSLMNKRMKLFHETKVRFSKVDIDSLIT